MKVRKNSGLWHYLNNSGVLEWGREEDITKAKKEYRKQYHKAYKRIHRKSKHEYCVICTLQEDKIFKEAAKMHGLSVPRFLKKASTSYLKQGYLVPHSEVLHRIEQLLLVYKNTIWQLSNKDKSTWYKPDRTYQDLENIVLSVQQGITATFKSPPSLSQVIWQNLQSNPLFKDTLQEMLTVYDSQKHVS